jgi:hypothetical protein
MRVVAPGQDHTGWWDEPFRVFQTNLREIDADMDVAAVADDIGRFGADTWLVNAGGILSWYPTDLEFQTRNPHLAARPSQDLLGDALAAAHRRGLRLIARLDLSKTTEAIARQHPDWCFVGPDGQWQVYNGLVSTCPSADYYQQRSFDILDEILDRYDVDGFFFNMFGFNEVDYSGAYRGVSQTEASRAGFARFSDGLDLPTGPDSPHYALWRSWCATVVTDLGRRIRHHIKQRRPDAALLLRQSADVLFDEANNEVGRPLWHPQTSESASAVKTAHPGTATMENCVSFVDMPYRLAGEEPEHFAQYLIQAISRGANPSTYIMGIPGDIPYPSLDLAGQVTRFHARWDRVYSKLAPVASLALVRPDLLNPPPGGHAQAIREFRGLYLGLQERHLPFDVIGLGALADLAEAGGLARFTDLVLPHLGPLPEPVRHALNAFTARGGRLLLTGRSGFDQAGQAQLDAMPASRLLDSITDAKQLQSSYVTEGDIQQRRFSGRIVPVCGVWHRLEPAPGAIGQAHFLAPAPFGPPEKAYGHRLGDQPGWLTSAGGITHVPWTAGLAYYELGLTSIRDHVVDRLASVRGPEAVAVDLPDQVEVTLLGQGDRLVVHLLNLTGRLRQSFTTPTPLRGGTVRLAGARPGTTARTLVGDQPCPTSWQGADLVIELPDIGRFEVLVIEHDPQELS